MERQKSTVIPKLSAIRGGERLVGDIENLGRCIDSKPVNVEKAALSEGQGHSGVYTISMFWCIFTFPFLLYLCVLPLIR